MPFILKIYQRTKEFWNKNTNLGPKKKREILMEIHMEDGDTCTSNNINDVLNKWLQDFTKLYSQGKESSVDDQYSKHVIKVKRF